MPDTKLTAETITDEQIRELRAIDLDGAMIRSIAGANDPHAISLVRRGLDRMCDDALDSEDVRLKRAARARCAEILNARNVKP